MERPGGLLLDRGHHRGMAVAEQQRAVAEHVADQLVAIQVPLARALGPRDGHRERRGEPDIVGDATRHQPPGPGMQRGRARILPRPPRYQARCRSARGRRRLSGGLLPIVSSVHARSGPHPADSLLAGLIISCLESYAE